LEQKDEKEGTLCHPWHLFPLLMEGFKKDEITQQRKIKPNHSLGWFKGIAGLENMWTQKSLT